MLYFFNWPSDVGGADTKLVHLLPLLAQWSEITLVPNDAARMEDSRWREWVAAHGLRTALRDELPDRLEGWAVSLCNEAFFSKGIAFDMRRRGLKVAWSSEMMWHFPAEVGAVMFGWVDVVMYVSAVQRAKLEPGYRHALAAGGGLAEAEPLNDPAAAWGELHSTATNRRLRWVMTGNYIDPSRFPFHERGHDGRPFTIGRLSRPDPDKYPDDFPQTYERLGLRDPCRFRVMGWSDALSNRWANHRFDERWELVPTAGEPTVEFLNSIDVLVYDVSPRFTESWGRAVVEAMLTGAVPLVPGGGGHHLENLVPHGHGGFHCSSAADYRLHARRLQDDPELLQRMSRAARAWAVTRLCQAETHHALWRRVFELA